MARGSSGLFQDEPNIAKQMGYGTIAVRDARVDIQPGNKFNVRSTFHLRSSRSYPQIDLGAMFVLHRPMPRITGDKCEVLVYVTFGSSRVEMTY